MPRFLILEPPLSPGRPIEFGEFVAIAKGLSISSASAASRGGPDFLELGLSRTFNLRLQANGGNLVVSLVSTLNADEFAPVRLEIIGADEVVTAELLELRLFYLRQVYATALLLGDNREDDLAGVLRDDPRADLEHKLVAEEDKLVVLDAGAGSLVLSLLAKTKAAYQAVLYACAVPFAEGRKALLGRVAAGTALAELEVRAKAQDVRLKGIDGLLGLAKKIDTIKDTDTRELIRQRFLTDMAGLAPTDVSTARPLALERAHTLEIPLVPPHASSDLAETAARPNRKRANRKKSTR